MKNKLKEIREKKRLSQEQLAEMSGVSRTTISDLENDKKQVITNITLEKIANALGKKITSIFFID